MNRFSLKTLVIVVAFAGVFLAWRTDHNRLIRDLAHEREQNLLSAFDTDTRAARIKEIANQENPDVPLLLYALSDPHAPVRQHAMDALTAIDTSKFVSGVSNASSKQEETLFSQWLQHRDDTPVQTIKKQENADPELEAIAGELFGHVQQQSTQAMADQASEPSVPERVKRK